MPDSHITSHIASRPQYEPFDWRDYQNNPQSIPEPLAAKLDELCSLINDGSEDGQDFLKHLHNYNSPTITLVTFFRGLLSPQEMTELRNALEAAEPRGFKKG